VFFGLLWGYGRDDLALVLYVLTFAPPYLLATRMPWAKPAVAPRG
jgi:hypothetical protein